MKKIFLLIVFSMFIAACNAEEAAESATDAPGAEAVADGTGLDRPLDGTSIETFEAGLEQIREEAAPEDYTRLKSALQRLLFYDVGARNDRRLLYQRLDGMTGNEIIERAES